MLQRFISSAILCLACLQITGCSGGPVTVSSDWVVAAPEAVLAPAGLRWRSDFRSFASRHAISLRDVKCSTSGKLLAVSTSGKPNDVLVFDATPKIIGMARLDLKELWCITDAGVLVSSALTEKPGNYSSRIWTEGGRTQCLDPQQPETLWLIQFQGVDRHPVRQEIAHGTLIGVGETCIALSDDGVIRILDLADARSTKNCRIQCPTREPLRETHFGDHDKSFAIWDKYELYVKRPAGSSFDLLPVPAPSDLYWLDKGMLTVLGHDDTYKIYQFHLDQAWPKRDVWPFVFFTRDASPDGRLARVKAGYTPTVTIGFENSIWSQKQGGIEGEGNYFPRALFERVP